MKTLLQILADELEEWPEGINYVAQDEADWCVWGFRDKPIFDGEEWWSDDYFEVIFFVEISSDWKTAIITRQQWEEARK